MQIRRLHDAAAAAARAVVLQALLAALQRNFTGLQIRFRQLRRQHIVLARQNGHGIQVFDDKLAVSDP